MSKEFEKHNPNNSDCPITRQISIATCTCPEQKEEWEEEYITLLGTLMEISAFSAYLGSFHHEKIKDFIRTQIALAEERGRRDGEAEGAKRMTAKVRGVLMLYPQEVHDELSIVLKDYLDELSTLTQKL